MIHFMLLYKTYIPNNYFNKKLEQNYNLNNGVKDKEKLKKTKKIIDVRLYNAQQQLATNQMDYEKPHDNYNKYIIKLLESEFID